MGEVSIDYQKISVIELTPSAIRRLKYVKKKTYGLVAFFKERHEISLSGKLFFNGLFQFPPSSLNIPLSLVEMGLLGVASRGDDDIYFYITSAGLDWLEFHKSRERKIWIPIIISTIALIISIIALINPK